MTRLAMTIPGGGPLHREPDFYRELEALGYDELWSYELAGHDGFVPLATAAAVTSTVRLGIAIAPAFTRGPAVLAQTAATLAAYAPGRFAMGIGSSSKVIVEDWNAVPFADPLPRTRDLARFLRAAMGGEKVTETYETFAVRNFRLTLVPEQPPTLLIAALRGGMLRMAGRESEGAVINWLSAEDVPRVAAEVHKTNPGAEIVCRIPVIPIADPAAARDAARFAVNTQLNIPVYAAFQEWLGRGERLTPMWDAWEAGDRKRALELVPDDVIDELVVHGSPEQIREHVQRFADHGVTSPMLFVMPVPGVDWRETCRALAPR